MKMDRDLRNALERGSSTWYISHRLMQKLEELRLWRR